MNSYYLLLLVALTSNKISCMNLIQKTETNVLECIERRLINVYRALTIPNDSLFKHEKTLTIDQFPKLFETPEKQVLSMASEIVKKLAYKGLSVDDIQQSKLSFYKINYALTAFDALKKEYPSLASKTTLEHWTSEKVDEKSEIFMTIVAKKKPLKKAAHL